VKNNRSIALLAALLVLVLFAPFAICGDVLINENFDAMNLEALQPGWTKAVPANLSIVPEEGHGKVLKIANGGNGDTYPFVMVALDAAKVTGKTVNVAVSARFPGAYVPSPTSYGHRPR